MIQPNESDIEDMVICGSMPRYWHWRKVYYALKNRMLMLYAQPDGFDMQSWYDEDMYDYTDDDSVFAGHYQVLERHILNGHLFHKPTDEFYYWNNYGVSKVSPNYETLRVQCKNKIEGKKKPNYRSDGFSPLKRLLRRHLYLLRGELV